jgi:hypothetical protein
MQRLLDRDLLTGLVLLCVYALFIADSSADPKDWIFPILANHVILIIGIVLLARGLFALFVKRLPDILRLTREERLALTDVLVFFLIVLAYMFIMYGLGFWLSSWLMLSITSIYLTLDKTPRNIRLAMVVPLGTCIACYYAFLYFFYVPFPRATWWIGFMPD